MFSRRQVGRNFRESRLVAGLCRRCDGARAFDFERRTVTLSSRPLHATAGASTSTVRHSDGANTCTVNECIRECVEWADGRRETVGSGPLTWTTEVCG